MACSTIYISITPHFCNLVPMLNPFDPRTFPNLATLLTNCMFFNHLLPFMLQHQLTLFGFSSRGGVNLVGIACCPAGSPLPGAVTCLAAPPPLSGKVRVPSLHVNVAHPRLDVRCLLSAAPPMLAATTLMGRLGDFRWRRIERLLDSSYHRSSPAPSAALA